MSYHASKRVNVLEKQPIFKSVLGGKWDLLPPVMRKHYANRAFSSDRVTVVGTMKVEISFFLKLMSPLMSLMGTLAPYADDDIPVTVHFDSEKTSNAFCLNRIFHYPGRRAFHFRSRMVPESGNAVIEYMSSGIGWHAFYSFDGQKIELNHLGYKLKAFGKVFSLPIEWAVGKGYAEEEALSDEHFRMSMSIRHPLFGKVYAYSGEFKIAGTILDD